MAEKPSQVVCETSGQHWRLDVHEHFELVVEVRLGLVVCSTAMMFSYSVFCKIIVSTS
jgi:hypothetical protein